jgi:hypothetical protein
MYCTCFFLASKSKYVSWTDDSAPCSRSLVALCFSDVVWDASLRVGRIESSTIWIASVAFPAVGGILGPSFVATVSNKNKIGNVQIRRSSSEFKEAREIK